MRKELSTSTNVITDYAIDFIDQAHQEKKPLFLYLAYNAPHFPLHAPKEVTDKYMSLYMQGWDKIRDARWKRIVDLKLMQGKPALSPRGVVPEVCLKMKRIRYRHGTH